MNQDTHTPEGSPPAAPGSVGREPEVGYVAAPMPVGGTAVAQPALSLQARYTRIGLLGILAAGIVAAALLIGSSTSSPRGTLAAGTTNDTGNAPVDLLNGFGPGGRGGHVGLGGITITAINGNDISLKTDDGWTRTITVDSGTTYSKSGASINLADLKVGDEVGFRQTRETDGTFTIDSIVVILPRLGGEVTKIDGSTITVTRRDGTTATITVNAQTKYSVNRNDGAALSDLKVGMFLVAEGTKNGDTSLTASRVKAAARGDFEGRGDHMGRGFGHGFGPGWDDRKPDASAAPSATGATS
jgi:hypothetical protein